MTVLRTTSSTGWLAMTGFLTFTASLGMMLPVCRQRLKAWRGWSFHLVQRALARVTDPRRATDQNLVGAASAMQQLRIAAER